MAIGIWYNTAKEDPMPTTLLHVLITATPTLPSRQILHKLCGRLGNFKHVNLTLIEASKEEKA